MSQRKCPESALLCVAADQLLVNKKYRELLQSYDVRCAAAVNFVESIRPGLEVVTGPLLDPKVQYPHGARIIQ